MTAEHYHALHSWMDAHPAVSRCVVALDRWLPLIPFVCYPVLLCLLNVRLFHLLGSQAALDFMVTIARAVFVPGFTFWGGTILRVGSSGSAVEQLQFWLNTLAQYESSIPSVTVDGVYGSGTAGAVRAFQRRYGLSVDGVVGRATWTELYDQFRSIQSDNGTPNAYPGTPLREGASGQNVRLVQFWLKIARTVYTSLANVTVDGKFGAGTAAAVQRFQRRNGLTADGAVGKETWEKMF